MYERHYIWFVLKWRLSNCFFTHTSYYYIKEIQDIFHVDIIYTVISTQINIILTVALHFKHEQLMLESAIIVASPVSQMLTVYCQKRFSLKALESI